MSSLLNRRQLVGALAAAAPLAALLADPQRVRAAAGSLEPLTLTTASGRTVQAALAQPAAEKAPAVLLIHEWWGLNDQIKAVAAQLGLDGYRALAVDLYDGKVASTREEAQPLMQAVDPAEATETLVAWVDWLKASPQGTGKVATLGWCFGGQWSLNASIATPVDATVIYYGRVEQPAERLARLKGPVQGHFATKDTVIDRPMVERFEKAMAEAKKSLTVYWYEADHAFANPTGARYDAEDAALAWQRTQEFLRAHF